MMANLGWGRRESDASRLSGSHAKLLAVAWPMATRLVRAAQRQFGVDPHEVFVTIVDVRGRAGRMIAEWTMGEAKVAARLLRTGMDRIVPLTIPLTIPEGASVTSDLAPDLMDALALRPPRTTPVLLIDVSDVSALAFMPATTLVGDS